MKKYFALFLLLIPFVTAETFTTQMDWNITNETAILRTESKNFTMPLPNVSSYVISIERNFSYSVTCGTLVCANLTCPAFDENLSDLKNIMMDVRADFANSSASSLASTINSVRNDSDKYWKLYTDCFSEVKNKNETIRDYENNFIRSTECDSKVSSRQNEVNSLNTQLNECNSKITAKDEELRGVKGARIWWAIIPAGLILLAFYAKDRKKQGKGPVDGMVQP